MDINIFCCILVMQGPNQQEFLIGQNRLMRKTHTKLPIKYQYGTDSPHRSEYGNILGLPSTPTAHNMINSSPKKLPQLHKGPPHTTRNSIESFTNQKTRKKSNPERADLLRLIQKELTLDRKSYFETISTDRALVIKHSQKLNHLSPLVKQEGMQGVRYKLTKPQQRSVTPPLGTHPISIKTAVKAQPLPRNIARYPVTYAYQQKHRQPIKEDKNDMDDEAFVAPWNIGSSQFI